MPFNTIPIQDFVDREVELYYLKRFAALELYYLKRFAPLRNNTIAGNIVLEGARGIGKTELIKQTYRIIFREEKDIVPFYYLFQRGTLKAAHFSQDYFTRFVRQYLAYLKKDPSLIDAMSTPLSRLIPVADALRVEWMIDLIEDFQEQMKSGDPYGQMLAAISAPVTAAARGGRAVFIMLDDFHVATQLYETCPGDVPGLISLFESSMKNYLCPHVLTGSPEGVLESIFSDNAFRGKAERMFINQLPADAAQSLFKTYCDKLGIKCDEKIVPGFIRVVGGNPLYIRNMVRALWKTQRKDVTEHNLWEAYCFEVCEGETAFYWSSIIGEFIRDSAHQRIGIKLLAYLIKWGKFHDNARLAKILGVPEATVDSVIRSLEVAGIVQAGGIRHVNDNVLRDFVQGFYMKEIEGLKPERIQELIGARYSSASAGAASSFEMVIPAGSDSELVAAKAVEQIGRNINLAPDVINRIQLAVIETCVKAMEHSENRDKKVFLKFTASVEKIEIIIESHGKFFCTEDADGPASKEKFMAETEGGLGLKLMPAVIDDFRVERTGEIMRVIFTKNVRPDEVLR
jgi:anti-sigma regulatory factor (Ser/Thr protein kinase)